MTDNTSSALAHAIMDRVLLLDGSTGVMFQRMNLDESAMRGRRFITHPYPLAGNYDALCLSRPDLVASVHRSYLEAGADIIETNTFNANRLSQARYGLTESVAEINRRGAAIARGAADRYMALHPGQVRYVAGSIGPTGVSASLAPDVDDTSARAVTFDELVEAYREQAVALIEGGVDVLLVETIFDLLNAKAAIYAIEGACRATGTDTPFILSVTVADKSGRLLSGHTVEAFLKTVESLRPLAVGFNCSGGPDSLAPALSHLTESSPFPVIFYPNAGLPDENGEYSLDAQGFAEAMRPFLNAGMVNIAGGCCGTTPEHIAALRPLVDAATPFSPSVQAVPGWLADLDVFHDDRGFMNVGERCNVAGSRKFLRLINEGAYDEAFAIARRQVTDGAMILDLNFDDGMLDARAEMVRFLRMLAADPSTSTVPWMIDTSDFSVAEEALKNVAGKAIVNSISLKHGEDEFLRQAAVIRRHGAAVVVMLFDESGQATTFEHKVRIAGRAYRLLVDKAGFAPADIIIDPNVLTIATGMPEHDRYALDFIRAVEWITANLPGAKTSGGVSNLSFAFRGNNYLRQTMHAVFLYHAIKAGLSMAIVDPGTKVTYADIPDELLTLLEDVILMRDPKASERLVDAAATYADRKPDTAAASTTGGCLEDMTAAQRVALAMRNGDASRLEADLDELVAQTSSAAAVVEGPLMEGMEDVGRLFEQGKMFLPQVVKSARIMHRAVSFLTPLLRKDAVNVAAKGTFILATVRGDVHDIGKNIVKVVLECNGYRVIDLGVQVEPSAIIEAIKTHTPDFVGLSGLIAPSLGEMATVAKAMDDNGFTIPLFVGGAATSDLHTAVRIAPFYPHGTVVRIKDAARNPVMANRFLMDAETTAREIKEAQRHLAEASSKKYDASGAVCKPFAVDWTQKTLVVPRTDGSKVLEPIPVNAVRQYINWTYFYNCWMVTPHSDVADGLLADAERLLDELEADGTTMLATVAFHKVYSDGSAIVADGVVIPTPRQKPSSDRDCCLALCDFVAPEGYGDHIGCFAVTIDALLRQRLTEAAQSGDSARHLLLQSVCDRLAEATSEYLHREVRTRLWGYAPDEPDDMTMIRRGAYQGIRPAVGYPSLPDQKLMHTLARLVPLDAIDIHVTANGALDPSSSVAGLYISAPEARYFSV